jgi:hypothetical protein
MALGRGEYPKLSDQLGYFPEGREYPKLSTPLGLFPPRALARGK